VGSLAISMQWCGPQRALKARWVRFAERCPMLHVPFQTKLWCDLLHSCQCLFDLDRSENGMTVRCRCPQLGSPSCTVNSPSPHPALTFTGWTRYWDEPRIFRCHHTLPDVSLRAAARVGGYAIQGSLVKQRCPKTYLYEIANLRKKWLTQVCKAVTVLSPLYRCLGFKLFDHLGRVKHRRYQVGHCLSIRAARSPRFGGGCSISVIAQPYPILGGGRSDCTAFQR
jgi:hypothetical protein